MKSSNRNTNLSTGESTAPEKPVERTRQGTQFDTFLDDPVAHQDVVKYWSKMVGRLLQVHNLDGRQWLNNPFQDEQVYHVYVLEKHRAVQIIQQEKESDFTYINPFIKSVHLTEEAEVRMLVIALEYSPKTARLAEDLIEKWLILGYDDEQMNKLIEKARHTRLKLTDQNKIVNLKNSKNKGSLRI